MLEQTLAHDLDQLVADEPPLLLTAGDVTRAGSRRVLLGRGAAAAGVVAVVGVSAVLASTLGSSPQDRVTLRSQPGQVVVEHPAGGPRSQQVMQLVLANSPDGWTYDFLQGVAPNDDGVDGTVDDGQGRSRTYVSVTHEAGNLTVNPCKDPEFVGSGSCTATPLSGGRTLIQRRSPAGKGVVTVTAGVLHSDGTGVYAESANAWWPHIADVESGQAVTDEQKEAMAEPEVTRALPVYTMTQLTRIVEAVDEALLPG
jgi:hypothetical protein